MNELLYRIGRLNCTNKDSAITVGQKRDVFTYTVHVQNINRLLTKCTMYINKIIIRNYPKIRTHIYSNVKAIDKFVKP